MFYCPAPFFLNKGLPTSCTSSHLSLREAEGQRQFWFPPHGDVAVILKLLLQLQPLVVRVHHPVLVFSPSLPSCITITNKYNYNEKQSKFEWSNKLISFLCCKQAFMSHLQLRKYVWCHVQVQAPLNSSLALSITLNLTEVKTLLCIATVLLLITLSAVDIGVYSGSLFIDTNVQVRILTVTVIDFKVWPRDCIDQGKARTHKDEGLSLDIRFTFCRLPELPALSIRFVIAVHPPSRQRGVGRAQNERPPLLDLHFFKHAVGKSSFMNVQLLSRKMSFSVSHFQQHSVLLDTFEFNCNNASDMMSPIHISACF